MYSRRMFLELRALVRFPVLFLTKNIQLKLTTTFNRNDTEKSPNEESPIKKCPTAEKSLMSSYLKTHSDAN